MIPVALSRAARPLRVALRTGRDKRWLLPIVLVLALGGCLRTRFDRCADFTADCRFLDAGPSGDAPPGDGSARDAPGADAADDAGATDAPGPDAPADPIDAGSDAPVTDAGTDAPAAPADAGSDAPADGGGADDAG